MSKVLSALLLIASIICGWRPAGAQGKPAFGSLEVSGRVKIDGKIEKLQRKRFYLLRGGLKENKDLIERLKKAEIVSRDCFYSGLRASPQFICWLKEENCDSPYCRKITETDIDRVPEFAAAFQAGLRQFGKGRTGLALDWLTTNLPPVLRQGFYIRQRSLAETLLADVRPLQSTMTDTVSVKAVFVDIPIELAAAGSEKKEPETFLVTNLLPLEIGGKSYLWACEIEIGDQAQAKLNLKVPEGGNTIKNCEVVVKDLPVCQTEGCKK